MKAASLRHYKEQKALTNKELAEVFGISEIYTLLLVSGKRIPGRKLALKISEITGIPILCLIYPENQNEN